MKKNKSIYQKNSEWLMYVSLYLLVFTLPLTEAVKNLALILFLIIAFYSTYKKDITIKFDLINISILLMPVFIFIGSYFSIDPKNTLEGLDSIATMSILFIYVRELSWTEKQVKYLFLSMFSGFLITLGMGYYKYIMLHKTFLELNSVGHVNHSAIYMLFIFTISLSYFILSYRKLEKKYLLFIMLVNISAGISVFVTGSRATMYSLLGILVLFIIYSSLYLNKKILLSLGALFLIGGILLYFSMNSYTIYKFQEGIFYVSGREDIAIGFINSWLHHNKLFGIGLNNSSLIELTDYYANYSTERISHYSHAHNTFLTYLSERGIVGLGIYIIFIFSILVNLLKKFFLNPKNKFVVMGIFIWILNFIISFANTTFHHENAILMLIIWALAIGTTSNEKTKIH